MINVDIKRSKGTYLVSLFIDVSRAVHFDSFREYIPHKVFNKIRDNQLLTIYLEYKIIIILCVDFIVLFS